MESLQSQISFIKNNIAIVTVAVTIALAVAGYVAAYINGRILSRKKDQLDLVNKRLNEFYGPLYVATQAGHIAYDALMKKLGKRAHVFEGEEEPTPSELDEWYLWMRTVFTPLNDIREKIIIEKAHLIIEEQMPNCLVEFVTHVVGYRAVLAKWQRGDFAEKYSIIDFPVTLDNYASKSYAALKSQQTQLLKSL